MLTRIGRSSCDIAPVRACLISGIVLSCARSPARSRASSQTLNLVNISPRPLATALRNGLLPTKIGAIVLVAVPAKPLNLLVYVLSNFDAFDEVWREFFPKTPPCRATVGTAGLLVPGCLVAVDLIATLPSSPGKVFSSTAPRAPVSYSEAIAVGDLVFASGLMASDYKTGVPPEAKVDPAFPYYGSEIKRQTR